jgi:hypothetical protein
MRCACCWLAAGLAGNHLQERAELQQRAVTMAHQLELQFDTRRDGPGRIDAIPAEAGCLAASAGLAAIVQSTPHARHACVMGRMVGLQLGYFPY